MNKRPNHKNTSKVRVLVDISFFILMILVLIPQTTGIAIHEWASFIILIPFLVHLLINWKWIARNSKKILQKQTSKTRFDYVFNWFLYLMMILVTISGIVISESVLPIFGIYFQPDAFWSKIHDVSAAFFMAFLGVHITLHWKWIVNAIRKLSLKADLRHLSEITDLIVKRSGQLLLLILISTFVSLAFWMFDVSTWAEAMRLDVGSPQTEASRKMPKKWMLFVLPLLKVTILISIPALIAGGVIRLINFIKARNPVRIKHY